MFKKTNQPSPDQRKRNSPGLFCGFCYQYCLPFADKPLDARGADRIAGWRPRGPFGFRYESYSEKKESWSRDQLLFCQD
jgi:hypothetical protein